MKQIAIKIGLFAFSSLLVFWNAAFLFLGSSSLGSKSSVISGENLASVRLPIDFRKRVVNDRYEYSLPITLENKDLFDPASELHILLGTHQKSFIDNHITIRQHGNSCGYSMQSDEIKDNSLVVLFREFDCRSKVSGENFSIVINSETDHRISLWSSQIAMSEEMDDWYFSIEGMRSLSAIPSFRNHVDPVKYSQLLSHVWGRGVSVSKIAMLFTVSVFLQLIAASIVIFKIDSITTGRSASLISLFLMVGLGLPYLVLAPPFHAPDEPDHFLSYLRSNNLSSERPKVLDLANKGHFKRIYFDSTENFSPEDISTDQVGGWPSHIQAPHVDSRSSLASSFWALIPYDQSKGVGLNILRFRAINLITVSLFVSAIIALLSHSSNGISLLNVLIFVLLAPCILFFAMHISNYALLTGLAVSVALMFSYLVSTRNVSWIYWIILGIVWSFCFLVGKLGVILAFLSASTLPLHFFFRTYSQKNDCFSELLRCAKIVFLVSLIVIIVTILCAKDLYLQNLRHSMPLGTRFELYQVWSAFFILYLFLCLTAVCIGQRIRKFQKVITKYLLYSLSATFLLFPFLMFMFSANSLENIENIGFIDKSTYVADVLKVFASNFALGDTDFYLGSTFWTGFGWLEADYGARFNYILKSIPYFALLATMYKFTVSRSDKVIWIVGAGLSLAVHLMLVAYMKALVPSNIHGRYLIGAYCFLIALCSLGITQYSNIGGNVCSNLLKYRTVIALQICLLINSYSQYLILNRYF